MTLDYHQRTFDLVGWEPRVDGDEGHRAQLAARSLPASVREWYSLENSHELRERFSNCDGPVHLRDLDNDEETANVVRQADRRLVVFLIENQGCAYWAYEDDAGDDPPVWITTNDGETWSCVARSFSAFNYLFTEQAYWEWGGAFRVPVQGQPWSSEVADRLGRQGFTPAPFEAIESTRVERKPDGAFIRVAREGPNEQSVRWMIYASTLPAMVALMSTLASARLITEVETRRLGDNFPDLIARRAFGTAKSGKRGPPAPNAGMLGPACSETGHVQRLLRKHADWFDDLEVTHGIDIPMAVSELLLDKFAYNLAAKHLDPLQLLGRRAFAEQLPVADGILTFLIHRESKLRYGVPHDSGKDPVVVVGDPPARPWVATGTPFSRFWWLLLWDADARFAPHVRMYRSTSAVDLSASDFMPFHATEALEPGVRVERFTLPQTWDDPSTPGKPPVARVRLVVPQTEDSPLITLWSDNAELLARLDDAVRTASPDLDLLERWDALE